MFEPVIGLEVHVQLATRTRLFSPVGRAPDTSVAPNHRTDPVTLGLPGTLPVCGRAAVELALRLAVALEGDIARTSRFVRKHYFYPDLPRNYQITQEAAPLVRAGRLRYETGGRVASLRLQRAHLEEDAARSVHRGGRTLVDFNRAGTALLEVVTAPELHSPDDAAAVLTALRELVRWLGVSEGDLEEGHLRCDANVSLRDRATGRCGARVELKNLNSIRGVSRALDHEIERQARILDAGGELVAQTRGWDEDRGESFAQRAKEGTVDYRFLDEPDLGPLVVDESMLEAARSSLPELPVDLRARWRAAGMESEAARVLSADARRAAWCDALLDAGAPAAELGRWGSTELLRRARTAGRRLEDLPWETGALAGLLAEVASGRRTVAEARELLDAAADSPLAALLRQRPPGSAPPVDEQVLRELLARHPAEVAHYRAGKLGLLGWFVGTARRENPQWRDPAAVARILRRLLSRDDP